MKAYILSSCSTCSRIMNEVDWKGEIHDIKTEGVPEQLLDELKEAHGSYESLFSRRAMKYKSMGLKEKKLDEADYKKLILEEYTFLKRPVFKVGTHTFVGNSKKVVESLKLHLESLNQS